MTHEIPRGSAAIIDVLNERTRQKEVEGWTLEHDDKHVDSSLALAAVCYAIPDEVRRYVRNVNSIVPSDWPRSWRACWWKPKDRRRDLVRAAALLIAEIERLDRAEAE